MMLPRSVHGDGERHGFIPQIIGAARANGSVGYLGEGANRWPAVHVKDAATLYRLAVEKAPAGSVLNAVGDEGVPTHEIAEAIAPLPRLPARSLPAEEFSGMLGTSSAPTCPPPAPSPRSSWAGLRPTPASSRTSNSATTSNNETGVGTAVPRQDG